VLFRKDYSRSFIIDDYSQFLSVIVVYFSISTHKLLLLFSADIVFCQLLKSYFINFFNKVLSGLHLAVSLFAVYNYSVALTQSNEYSCSA